MWLKLGPCLLIVKFKCSAINCKMAKNWPPIRIRISYPVCHSITAQFRSGQSSPFRAHGDNLFMEPPWTLNGLPHKSCGSTWYSIVNCRCLIIGLTAAAVATATSPTNMAALAAKACSMHHFECATCFRPWASLATVTILPAAAPFAIRSACCPRASSGNLSNISSNSNSNGSNMLRSSSAKCCHLIS